MSIDSRAARSPADSRVVSLFFPWAADLGDLGALSWRQEEGAYILEGKLSGFRPEDVDVDVRGRSLELRAGTFRQRFMLPPGTDAERIDVTVEAGTLAIRVPKLDAA